MIRVLVVDHHPAVRAGLQAFLLTEPGFVYAGDCDGGASLVSALHRAHPDVVLLDAAPRRGGLQLCHRLKQEAPAVKVVIFAAEAIDELLLPARLAGADGLIDKGTGARELFESLRRISRGECLIDRPPATVLRDALARVPADQRVLAGLLLDGTPEADAARALGTTVQNVRHGVHRVLSAWDRAGWA